MTALTYNFAVSNDWPFGAKDYFRMGSDETGMDQNEGISTFLVQFSAISNFMVPRGAQDAWRFLTSQLLNSMPLTESGWEDLNASTTGVNEKGCRLEFKIDSGDGVEQSLVHLKVYRDTKPLSSDDENLRFTKVDADSEDSPIRQMVRKLDPVVGNPLKLLADYYSPTYRTVDRPNTEVQLCLNEDSRCVRRRIYCRENDFGVKKITVWWVEIQTFVLSETFQERYVPLSLEDEEAELFFGHIPLRPLSEILRNLGAALKDSVRLYKARRFTF